MTLEQFLRDFGSTLSGGLVGASAVALAGGIVASAVCPCTVPMGLGMAGVVSSYEEGTRRRGFAIAVAFFLGIVLNLTMLGAMASRIGSVLTEAFGKYWTLAMAMISFSAAALAFYGPRLGVDKLASLRKPGMTGAFIYGFIFSLGTSAAPLLLLLTVAAAKAQVVQGVVLAMAFGIGRGLPFLIIGMFAGALVRFARVGLWRRTIQYVSGVALLFVGFYYTRAFMVLA